MDRSDHFTQMPYLFNLCGAFSSISFKKDLHLTVIQICHVLSLHLFKSSKPSAFQLLAFDGVTPETTSIWPRFEEPFFVPSVAVAALRLALDKGKDISCHVTAQLGSIQARKAHFNGKKEKKNNAKDAGATFSVPSRTHRIIFALLSFRTDSANNEIFQAFFSPSVEKK